MFSLTSLQAGAIRHQYPRHDMTIFILDCYRPALFSRSICREILRPGATAGSDDKPGTPPAIAAAADAESVVVVGAAATATAGAEAVPLEAEASLVSDTALILFLVAFLSTRNAATCLLRKNSSLFQISRDMPLLVACNVCIGNCARYRRGTQMDFTNAAREHGCSLF